MLPILLLFLPQISSEIFGMLDKTMIEVLTHQAELNAYYQYSQKIVKIILIGITSLGIVMIPSLLTIIGCLAWGFLVNLLMCITLGKSLATGQDGSFLMLVVPLQIASCFMNAFSKKAITKFIAYNMLVVPMGLEIAFVVGVMAEVGLMDAVTMALIGTLVIGAVMFIMAYVKPEVFLSLGKTLLIVTFAAIPAAILIAIFAPAAYAAFDMLFIVLFALWLGFDISRAMAQPKSTANAITSAFDVYYDLAYIFLRLLLIMAKNSSRK